MGTYITHEGLPFHGNLKKIRIRSYRATDPSMPGFDEEQLLEITRDGTVKLTQKTPSGTEKVKTRISQADAAYIFAAFSEVFASYRREHIPSLSGHWRVRLLTDNNEVYFYHGANGQDYRYHDESLTDILRQRTGMQKLFGLSVKAETKSKVESIEISLEQTATDEVKDKYASEYGICIHDINEWLCALPGFVDSKNEEKTERNAGYLVVSHSGGGMLRQGTRKGIRRTPANRGMRAHRIVKSLDISEDVCHGLCP